MAGVLDDFVWQRSARAAVVETKYGGLLGQSRSVVVQPGKSYKPFAVFPTLFAQFANVKDEAGILDFVKNFGRTRQYTTYAVDSYLSEAEGFRAVLKASESGRRIPAVEKIQVEAAIVADADSGAPGLRLLPKDLYAGMWLQLGSVLGSGGILRSCRHCGEWFSAGSGNRRADAQFCKPEHKTAHFSLARSKKAPRS